MRAVTLKSTAIKVILAITLLWLIKGAEMLFDWDFRAYGVVARELSGLIGIILAPLIHGSFEHLFANTLPVFVLATALFYEYPKSAKPALTIIYIGSGLGVWLFAREATTHFGASGLTHGMLFFLFFIGVFRRDKPAMAVAMIVFFLYGGMLLSILPREEHISFEYHLFGALMGLVCAVIYRNRDPKPPVKQYSWEGEEEELDDENAGYEEEGVNS